MTVTRRLFLGGLAAAGAARRAPSPMTMRGWPPA